jgi:sec-independent protein translocase protein TatB
MRLVLFIFESIGTQELLLIGIVALIFLGPRRMPEMARKLGKMMADFRNVTSEFKSTWEKEVNFEHEAEAMKTGKLPEDSQPVPRENSILPAAAGENDNFASPEIKSVDPAIFHNAKEISAQSERSVAATAADTKPAVDPNSKENWL